MSDDPVVHLTLNDALRDIKKRCRNPQSVVFDLDGTLLLGKTPVSPLCKYYTTLCVRSGCDVRLVTARCSTKRGDTIRQLQKNNLDCCLDIRMREPSVSEEDFKIRSLSRIKPDLTIGNRWHDLDVVERSVCVTLPGDAYIVGNSWLKVPG
jgi:hypothetical protein